MRAHRAATFGSVTFRKPTNCSRRGRACLGRKRSQSEPARGHTHTRASLVFFASSPLEMRPNRAHDVAVFGPIITPLIVIQKRPRYLLQLLVPKSGLLLQRARHSSAYFAKSGVVPSAPDDDWPADAENGADESLADGAAT